MNRYNAPQRLRPGSLAEQVLILVAHLQPATLDEVAAAQPSRPRAALSEALSRLTAWGWLTAEGDQGCKQSGPLRRYWITDAGRALIR